MKSNSLTREFDVRLRDEDNDRENKGLSETEINRIAEAEAKYNPTDAWEASMQALGDLILSQLPKKYRKPED